MFGEVIFWFCVAGAGIAALKHLLRPLDVIKVASCYSQSRRPDNGAPCQEFTPVALRNEGKDISPEALWWGSIAFSAMNLGFFTVGLWSGIKGK